LVGKTDSVTMRIKRKLQLHYGATKQVVHLLYIVFETLIIPV